MLHSNSAYTYFNKIARPSFATVLVPAPAKRENRGPRGKSTKRKIAPERTEENNKRLRTPPRGEVSPTLPKTPTDPVFRPLTYEDVYCSGIKYLSDDENDDAEVREAFTHSPRTIIPVPAVQPPTPEHRPATPRDPAEFFSSSDEKSASVPKLLIFKSRDFSAQTDCDADFSYDFGTHTKINHSSRLKSDRPVVDASCQTDPQDVRLALAQVG